MASVEKFSRATPTTMVVGSMVGAGNFSLPARFGAIVAWLVAGGGMLVTVFVFIGIEGASVYSRYARRREDVGRETVTGVHRGPSACWCW